MKAAVSLEAEVSVTLLKEVKVYSETEDAAKIIPLTRREAGDFLQVLLTMSAPNVASACTVWTVDVPDGCRNVDCAS